MKKRILTRLFAVAVLAVSLTAAKPAQAATIQLGFILDSSGSIGSSNWSIILTGLSNAINLIPLPGVDTYEVSVVSFSSTAVVVVNHVAITSAAARTGVGNSVLAAAFLNANTNFALAFSTMQSTLTSAPGYNAANKAFVNFATDGVPNEGGGEAGGVTARDALIAAGIDNVSVEGIGGGVNTAYLTGSICYPQACDTVQPFDTFPANGFYRAFSTAQEYADALSVKVQVITGQTVPEPTSVVLLGTGLLFAAHRLRRRKA